MRNILRGGHGRSRRLPCPGVAGAAGPVRGGAVRASGRPCAQCAAVPAQTTARVLAWPVQQAVIPAAEDAVCI